VQRIASIILSLGIFLLLIVGYLHPITAFTQDLGRHILTGKIILTSFAIPKENLLSYTAPTFPFVNHHWFSEVLFYLQHQFLGTFGLQLISLTVALAAFAIVYIYALKRASLPAVVIVTLVYLRILFERTDIRPELYSFFLLSIFITILYGYREKFTKLIYLLLPLELLWVNTHIYFFVGIVIFSLFVIDEIFSHRRALNTKHTKTLLIVFIATCFITLLNPNGITGATYPLHVFQNYGYTIEENQTLFFLEDYGFARPAFLYFKIAVLLLFLSLAINYKNTKPIDWLLACVFTYAGVMAVRNFPLLVYATFIPACIALSGVFSIVAKHTYTFTAKPFIPFLLGLLIIWQLIAVVGIKPVGFGVAKGAERAADFYLINNISGPLFNNFDIGSYIAYRMYPKEKVFIDGRPEAYPANFIQGVYIPLQEDPKLFSEATKKYGFNAIFFSHTDMTPWANAFLQEIIKSPDWQTVYLDDTVIILLKKNTKNEALLKKYGMTSTNLKAKDVDQNDRNSLLRLASFYNKVALTDQELASYQRILQIDPNNCPALYNTTMVISYKNDPTSAIFASRYKQQCAK
jgi:hypothetical protein